MSTGHAVLQDEEWKHGRLYTIDKERNELTTSG